MVTSLGARRLARAAGILLSAALLGGLVTGASRPEAVVKDDTFLDAETPGVLNIEAGECFDDPEYDVAFDGVIVLYRPCVEGAQNQSYGFIRAPDGDWDEPSLRAYAWDGCRRAQARRWPAGDPGVALYPVLPTRETWADGDRTVMCVRYRPTGRLSPEDTR
ncbi:hypothetical protein RB614_00545 [Phytohabitans sp. ZYX-F-186]|uniref:Septum formation-related domain-containing protein n=1 Tax=Phytohabitans maris TaxID=3071409 RepID=A0ABU0ZAM7_9ACTN|nr:hypothetical protein [Phytohabitans sp. ZYX-F-186]MDQ7903007.1 hypothetical protein [Phytohabitans sp. ZYX-F-186]